MRVNWAAARTSAILSILFLVVYGGTNLLASTRAGVPTLCFAWERSIPFVPWMFVPYVSIDLFFVCAPFLCRSDRERRTLARQIGAAILAAGAIFLLAPLRQSFERPPVDGILGGAFEAFRQMDKPFNQLPSLHITLALLLMPVYLRRTEGLLKLLVIAWFLLILASPLLVWQHHALDVVAGALLALVCSYVFRDQPLRMPVTVNRRIALYYAAGTTACLAAAFAWLPWTIPLLWPALTLATVAAAYLGLGPGIYRKQDGRLPLAARVLLWPMLLGQRASLAKYSRRGRPWNELTRNVLIGRVLSHEEAKGLTNAGVSATLDLTCEFDEARPLMLGRYLNVPILDLSRPTEQQIAAAVAFVQHEAERGTVYIHCKLGYSRTAAVAGAYMLTRGIVHDADSAIARLQSARPDIIIRPEAEAAIRGWAATRTAPPRPAAMEERPATRPGQDASPSTARA